MKACEIQKFRNFKIKVSIMSALGKSKCQTDHLGRLSESATRAEDLCINLELEIALLSIFRNHQEFLIENLPESATRHELRDLFRTHEKTDTPVPLSSYGKSRGFV